MEILAGEQSCYTLLAFICLKMEIHWRSNPVGKVQKNLPFFKEIEKKEFTQNIRHYLITVVAYIANQRLFNF